MDNRFIYFIFFTLFLSFISCATVNLPPSATPSGPRTIIIQGEPISEKDVEGFTSWYCKDYVYPGPTLVEVGFFNNLGAMIPDSVDISKVNELNESYGLPELDDLLKFAGFILYDGGFSGEHTMYQRTGLEHRWSWSTDGGSYSFIIKPDGTGLYYDFSNIPDGETTTAKEVYRCSKR